MGSSYRNIHDIVPGANFSDFNNVTPTTNPSNNLLYFDGFSVEGISRLQNLFAHPLISSLSANLEDRVVVVPGAAGFLDLIDRGWFDPEFVNGIDREQVTNDPSIRNVEFEDGSSWTFEPKIVDGKMVGQLGGRHKMTIRK